MNPDRQQDRKRHDPPDMWSGFYGRLPNLDSFTPRMGLVQGMELHVPDAKSYPTPEEARAAGRAAAWERHDDWQAKAPHKTMGEHIRDEYLAGLAQDDEQSSEDPTADKDQTT